jgi:cytidylate kinase
MSKIIIAIDGHSSCGKSTLAKALAKAFGYAHINTGAMYRATTLYFLENDVDINSLVDVEEALQHIKIHFEHIEGKTHTFLNGKDVESNIRTMRINDHVSDVAKISMVRTQMVEQQREMSESKGIVMEGRDIGTVVFPNAELKIFLTAAVEERARRRYEELKANGQDVTYEVVKENLAKRDFIDSNRENSPLSKAEDAIILDNTNLSPQEQLDKSIELVNSKLRIKN